MTTKLARKVNRIMCDGSTIVKQRQLAMRREMDRRGIALKVVSLDSGVPYSTLASYFPADRDADPAQMPTGVQYDLMEHVPADIMSMLLPNGWQAVRLPDDLDHDALCDLAADYVKTKADAHRADSPAGVDIAPCEKRTLDAQVVALRAA